MVFIRSMLVCGCLGLAAISTSPGQTPEDFALLKKVQAAVAAAPACRITTSITDRDSGAAVEHAVIERVPPDSVHFVITHNGQPGSEMISDGQRSLRRTGPNEPWKSLPMNLSAMMNESQKAFAEDHLREVHGHLKLAGDDQIGGVAAKVYELTEDSGPSKLWIAADTSRPLKVERDYDGAAPGSAMKRNANGKVDLKSLQAQLKAATAQHHLRSVSTYEYDPSIKITMPEN